MRYLVVLALWIAACGQKDAPKAPAPKSEAAKTEAPPPAPPIQAEKPKKLDGLKVTLPDGWKSEYIADSDLWVFQAPLADGRSSTTRIGHAPTSLPNAADAYIEHKKKGWVQGTTAEIVTQEPRPGGFAATLKVNVGGTDPNPKTEYHAVFEVGGTRLRCENEWIPEDALRDQVAALCRSAAF